LKQEPEPIISDDSSSSTDSLSDSSSNDIPSLYTLMLLSKKKKLSACFLDIQKKDRLSDRQNPNFAIWYISINNKFIVNSDYYPSQLARIILVWSATTNNTKKHLKTRY
jgi:hypothetical protein